MTSIKDIMQEIRAEESCSKKEQDRLGEMLSDVETVKAAEGCYGTLPRIDDAASLNVNTPMTTISAPPLHGENAPAYLRQREKAEHRIIAELKLTGRTSREIAEVMGCSVVTVQDILKQPHVDTYIRHAIAERGGLDVMNFMATKAMQAAETLVDGFSRDEMPERRDKVNAADKLLDRIFGKPNQPISDRRDVDMDKLTDAELERIARAGR